MLTLLLDIPWASYQPMWPFFGFLAQMAIKRVQSKQNDFAIDGLQGPELQQFLNAFDVSIVNGDLNSIKSLAEAYRHRRRRRARVSNRVPDCFICEGRHERSQGRSAGAVPGVAGRDQEDGLEAERPGHAAVHALAAVGLRLPGVAEDGVLSELRLSGLYF